MGGDFAPRETVIGGIQAAEARPDDEIILVGDRAAIETELDSASGSVPDNISVVHAPQVIAMDEKPVEAIRRKPDSSILRAVTMIGVKEAEAVVSAGNTGAMVAAAMLSLRRLPGVRRAGIAASVASASGHCTLIDVGANLNCKPLHLCQYGIMASIYHAALFQCENPRVGLLNVGEEESKGNPLLHEASLLLSQAPVNFVGNAEGQDIFRGHHEVIVCGGFVGNAVLKAAEGFGETLEDILRTAIFRDVWGRLSFNLMRPVLLNLKRRVDFADYGGAPLLGVEGGVFICHGRSSALAIRNATMKAYNFIRTDVNGSISATLGDDRSTPSPEKE